MKKLQDDNASLRTVRDQDQIRIQEYNVSNGGYRTLMISILLYLLSLSHPRDADVEILIAANLCR